MLSDPLQVILDTVPQPSNPDRPFGQTTSSRLGLVTELPSDYLAFMDAYGPGSFASTQPFLHIYDVSDYKRELETAVQVIAESHHCIPETFPPAFPIVPGILPWGTYDQGYDFYWLVNGASDDWTVVADLRLTTLRQHAMSMTAFLASVVCPSFPAYLDLISERENITYIPASRIRGRE